MLFLMKSMLTVHTTRQEITVIPETSFTGIFHQKIEVSPGIILGINNNIAFLKVHRKATKVLAGIFLKK